jgi:hypothetical protein
MLIETTAAYITGGATILAAVIAAGISLGFDPLARTDHS